MLTIVRMNGTTGGQASVFKDIVVVVVVGRQRCNRVSQCSRLVSRQKKVTVHSVSQITRNHLRNSREKKSLLDFASLGKRASLVSNITVSKGRPSPPLFFRYFTKRNVARVLRGDGGDSATIPFLSAFPLPNWEFEEGTAEATAFGNRRLYHRT